jgi:hypothetical protein
MEEVPKFAEIAGAPDAEVQRALAGVSAVIIAAALEGAPSGVSRKIFSSLSERRRGEVSAQKGPFGDRTRTVARQALVKAVFGVEAGDEPAPPEPKAEPGGTSRGDALRSLLEKLGERHPDFIEARKQRRLLALMEHLRRMLEGHDEQGTG